MKEPTLKVPNVDPYRSIPETDVYCSRNLTYISTLALLALFGHLYDNITSMAQVCLRNSAGNNTNTLRINNASNILRPHNIPICKKLNIYIYYIIYIIYIHIHNIQTYINNLFPHVIYIYIYIIYIYNIYMFLLTFRVLLFAFLWSPSGIFRKCQAKPPPCARLRLSQPRKAYLGMGSRGPGFAGSLKWWTIHILCWNQNHMYVIV